MTKSTILYGIPICDSVKKARALLAERGIEYVFHDYKKLGVPEKELARWVAAKGWEVVLNRKGTTWRTLDDATKESVVDAASAIRVMIANPSTIKRPVIARNDSIAIGFDADWISSL